MNNPTGLAAGVRAFFGVVGELYKGYEDIKKRNDHERVIFNGCDNVTNCFMHRNHYEKWGGRYGVCGTRKDHSRIYLCPEHHESTCTTINHE